MLKRSLIVLHRWLGVALCLNFVIWFVSGIGMMYWDFPSVSAADRLARAPLLDRDSIKVSVADALATAGLESADEARLQSFDGRPIYRLTQGRTQHVIYADARQVRSPLSRQQVDRVAEAWIGKGVNASAVEALDDVDQWTVQLPLAGLKPVWRYSWPTGEQIYVSQATGEVVQYTTRATRLGAFVGAIPHWMYITPLRKHGQAWSRIVIGLSAIGTVVAALGLTIGALTFSPSRRYRHGSARMRLPYRGWKRWHALLGLLIGIGALTWVFSGWLSMDPITLPGDPARADDVAQALRGTIHPQAFAARSAADVLASLDTSNAKQVEFISFGERAFYLVTLDTGDTRLVDVSGAVHALFEANEIASVVAAAVRPDQLAETRWLNHYDRYYLDRHHRRPLPVVLVRLGDRPASRFYVDPKTVRLAGTYSTENWVTRWLYHGLHSLDFPWLYDYRPLWDIVVGAFMIGGSVLCFTSLVLAWQVLGRALAR